MTPFLVGQMYEAAMDLKGMQAVGGPDWTVREASNSTLVLCQINGARYQALALKLGLPPR